ncbi:ATP-dependent DNA helicase PIF1-like [Medicago truncatula]|uniref:ATP-dependent DNA helicase PIF1-like n=1 Tax=Medicago truncatula TaxID=3880 RepID=UPI000D2F2FF8|nr:ATP-dependent DNA helicase PIF1-like [Medicago truncatula]
MPKQGDLAKLMRRATAIIWDEAPMINKYCVEALDRTLQDVMGSNAPFGGKVVIMGGDFRQVLPVIAKANKSQMIYACIVRSNLWAITKVLHLRQNMRSMHDHEFAEFLMRIGDGNEPTKSDDMFPAEEHNLFSFDEVEGDSHNLYQQEYLNTIATGSLPPHILKLKEGAPLMLLQNIDPKYGLCNETRLLCRGLFCNLLDVEILTGSNAGNRAFLPRIKLKTTEGAGLPFVLSRKQFPVKLSFAITINKSQGKTIPKVGIYLTRHVFSHGQLYVALSRGVSRATTRVLIKDGKLEGEDGKFTKNVVYKEILFKET